MHEVRRLTVWAVKHPPGFFAKLPSLQWLDVQGGSGESTSFVEGCQDLRYLNLNQILGLTDLSAIEGLVRLEYLSIYGQPRVETLPDLSGHVRLVRLELGSLKGLQNGIGPALRAPALAELMLIRAVAVAEGDAALVRDHPTLRTFDWFSEDVPRRIVEPFMAQADKPSTRPLHAYEWFAERAKNGAASVGLSALSDKTRAAAIVEPSGTVRWPLAVVEQAIRELAEHGCLIIGLDVWGDQLGSPSQTPFWVYGAGLGSGDVEPALQLATDALRHHPALGQKEAPSVIVTWVNPDQTEAPPH